MNTKIKLVAATLMALGVSAGAAQAAPIFTSGSFAINFTGDVINTYPTQDADIPASNIFTITPETATINAPVTGSFASDTNLTSGDTISPFSSGNPNFTPGAADASLDWTALTGPAPGTVGTFTAVSVSYLGTPVPGSSVTYLITGTFTTGSDWANSVVANAKEIIQFNEISQGVYSGSGSFTANVPEPSTLSLFGVALVGFGFLQLRKKRKSAFLAS